MLSHKERVMKPWKRLLGPWLPLACILLAAFLGWCLYENCSEQMTQQHYFIRLTTKVKSIDRIRGGIVVSGTVVVTNTSAETLQLGEESVLSMLTLRLRDVGSGVVYQTNLSSNRSVRTLETVRVSINGLEEQQHDFSIDIMGPAPQIGTVYRITCDMRSNVGEFSSKPVLFVVIH